MSDDQDHESTVIVQRTKTRAAELAAGPGWLFFCYDISFLANDASSLAAFFFFFF
ncbi:MAG: hypothetical protein U5L02_08485 [Rheinheimera sp.]|nr:hypothetical protein [Rheinheimera sp.]